MKRIFLDDVADHALAGALEFLFLYEDERTYPAHIPESNPGNLFGHDGRYLLNCKLWGLMRGLQRTVRGYSTRGIEVIMMTQCLVLEVCHVT